LINKVPSNAKGRIAKPTSFATSPVLALQPVLYPKGNKQGVSFKFEGLI